MKKCTHGERARAQRVKEGCRTLKDLVSLSLFAVELTIVAGVCAAAIRHRGQASLLTRGRHSPAGRIAFSELAPNSNSSEIR